MNESSPRAVLNTLIESCKDAERGLLRAAELVTDPALKVLFADTARKRAKFASQLLPHAERLGGATTADGTTSATFHRKWMGVRSALSGRDDSAVVAEVRRGDNLTVLAFQTAVEDALPATVRDLVELGYADVRASHLRFDELQQVAQ